MSKIGTKEIYAQIVDKFKEELRSGQNPFHVIAQAINMSSERAYTGFNRWHLGMIAKNEGFSTAQYATYKQISEKGGQIRKGEKGHPVFFWGTLYVFKGNIVASGSDEMHALNIARKKDASLQPKDLEKKNMFIKHFSVFNIDQADNVEPLNMSNALDNPINKLLGASEATIINGTIPMYDIEKDSITYPDEADTEDGSLVLKALFESTGHSSRLNREFNYSEEQLISSIGASFLASSAEVDDINFDEQLIDSWLEKLEENPMFLYKAASQAHKGSDLLLDKALAISESISIAKAS